MRKLLKQISDHLQAFINQRGHGERGNDSLAYIVSGTDKTGKHEIKGAVVKIN
jgi:hypothetical protein